MTATSVCSCSTEIAASRGTSCQRGGAVGGVALDVEPVAGRGQAGPDVGDALDLGDAVAAVTGQAQRSAMGRMLAGPDDGHRDGVARLVRLARSIEEEAAARGHRAEASTALAPQDAPPPMSVRALLRRFEEGLENDVSGQQPAHHEAQPDDDQVQRPRLESERDPQLPVGSRQADADQRSQGQDEARGRER